MARVIRLIAGATNSYVSVDPNDDMTMWCIQEFCDAASSYGVRVIKLLAPGPAQPASCVPASLNKGVANVNVVLTGTALNGTGFFDPGIGFVNHIAASVAGSGVTVNSVAYTDPTHVTLNISVASTAAAGARAITITNPDGQQATSASGMLTINPSADLSVSATAAPAPVAAGYQLKYHIVAGSAGPDPAANTVVTLPVPSGTAFVSSSPATTTQTPTQLTYALGTIANGSSTAIDLLVSVFSATTNPISLTAAITSDALDTNTANNSSTLTTPVLADSDRDGMPDTWELDHGFDPNNAADALLDFDGDGFTNLQEYVAGTDPRQPTSRLSVRPVVSGNDVQIIFPTVSGKVYRVERTNDLSIANWTTFTGDVIGTGNEVTVTDSGATSSFGKRFYRLSVIP